MIARKNSYLASATVLISFLTLVGAIVWASVATIDQVSRASGQIIPAGRVQVVQSVDGGTIVQLHVQEGDRVSVGQVLVELDQRQLKAAYNDAKIKVAALEISNFRIEAELFDRPLEFPEELKVYPIFVANQSRLFERRLNGQRQAVAALEHSVAISRQAYDLKKSLVDKSLALRPDLLVLEQSLSEAEAELSARVDKYLEDLQTEYSKNSEELATAKNILLQRKASLENATLKAPVSGIVKNLHLTTVGGVFRAGDEVLQIVPLGDDLIVEAKLPPSEISHVWLGQVASLKFDAYDSSVFGSATGEVIYVSPDTLTEMRNGGELAFYRVRLSVDTSHMLIHDGISVDLQPGMTATVEIKGGVNTVLNFLLKPISKTFSDSFGER